MSDDPNTQPTPEADPDAPRPATPVGPRGTGDETGTEDSDNP